MAMSLLLVGGVLAGAALAAPAAIEQRAPAMAMKEHTVSLQRNFVVGAMAGERPFHRKIAEVLEATEGDQPLAAGWGQVRAAQHGIEYITDVKAGNGVYQLIVDTGSSDTWIVKSNFSCLNTRDYNTRNWGTCNFGSEFKGEFSGGKIANQHLNITYGGGPYLLGEMGISDITVSNITVPKQQIGLATIGKWRGDKITSGILGLGLPGLTDAFSGSPSDYARDTAVSIIPYNPIVSTVATQLSPLFALALSRDPGQSFLSFGGIPAGTKTTGGWATTPLKKVKLRSGSSEYLYYQIGVDKMVWNGTTDTTSGGDSSPPDYIVDSGTTLNLMPYAVAEAINNAFQPPAAFDGDGQWVVSCNAKAPAFGIQVGGVTLWTDPASLILPETRNSRGECLSGIGTTGSWPYILGDTFMQQLITVFDISDKMQVKFAKRA